MSTLTTEAETADMRETIATQVLNWIDGARWEDPQRAERVAWKLAEAPELFVSPNPGENVSWVEEASRIYHEIKDEHALRTVSEAKREARDYNDRAKRHAAEHLREHGEDVADDVAAEFGWSFVSDVLGYDPRDRRPSLEEQAAAVVEELEADTEAEPEPEPETVSGSVTVDDVTVSADTPAVMTDGGWLANGGQACDMTDRINSLEDDGRQSGKPPPPHGAAGVYPGISTRPNRRVIIPPLPVSFLQLNLQGRCSFYYTN